MSAFQLPSAKNLTIKKTVEAFVPTELYWEILSSDSNDVVFGTRGSGKTMLLRMMSVPHLVEFARTNLKARTFLFEERRFGVFLPLGIDWCVSLAGPGQQDVSIFTQGVNIAAAGAFVETLAVLVHSVLQQPELEHELVRGLVAQWFRARTPAVSFADIRLLILREQAVVRDRTRNPESGAEGNEHLGDFMGGSLFAPIADGTRVANGVLGLPNDHRWLLCVDELEGLHPHQMRLLATFLRGTNSTLALKITTLPYTFESVETDFAASASAVDFRDYEIKRLQYDPQDTDFQQLVLGILRKRTSTNAAPVEVFGDSEFSDRAESVAPQFGEVRRKILARENHDSARKSVPVAAIRTLRRAVTGNHNSSAYSGWTTLARLSDGNPGMFVRLLNALRPDDKSWPVSGIEQHRVVKELAASWLDWSQALYEDGAHLRDILVRIGEDYSRKLHDRSVDDLNVQEEANRFRIDLRHLSERDAKAFRVAARHGLLVAEAQATSFRYPANSGVWRLSYALAPHFWLLPRRGRVARVGQDRAAQLALDFGQQAGDSDGNDSETEVEAI